MALVGQAAMVAQFAGVDAYGLIKMIAEAAQTVRRNRATCLQLARRAKMIGDLLHQLHSAQLMQQPETRNPVEQLEETLRHALLLVRSCRGRGYLYRCFMGARHADELREVQGEITFYLQLFPLVSYVDTTLTWVRLLNKAAPEPSCKEAPVVRPYFVPFLFLSPDEWCLVVIQEDHEVPGLEAQLLVPLDHRVPGSNAQLLVPSHDATLKVPKVACVLHHT